MVSVFEEVVAPGSGPPIHAHRHQGEIFHIIEGRFRFYLAGKEQEAGPGDAVFIPRRTAHAFQNIGDAPARLHFELFPANTAEAFFRRLAEDFDQLDDPGEFFSEHGMDLLGPPLNAQS